MKRTSLIAVLLLVVGLLAGCGGDSSDAADGGGGGGGGIPTDASVEDFCGVFLDLISQAQEAGGSEADAVKLAKDLAAKLEKTGTPSDMPAEARRAFETAIEKINDLPDDATQEEMDKASSDLTDAEKKDQEALSDYISTTCIDQLTPSESPSS